MIQAQELRLGNLVIAGNEIIKVKNITEGYINYWQDMGASSQIHVSDLSALPLTDKLLVKFGFKRDYEKSSYHHLTYQLGDFEILELEGRYYEYESRPRVKIEYVHQLQNLYFSINREELKIIPTH